MEKYKATRARSHFHSVGPRPSHASFTQGWHHEVFDNWVFLNCFLKPNRMRSSTVRFYCTCVEIRGWRSQIQPMMVSSVKCRVLKWNHGFICRNRVFCIKTKNPMHRPGKVGFFPSLPSLPDVHARTCVGTFSRLEPMWQYLVKITNIKVDITFIILKLIDGVPSHAKGA